MFPICFCFVFVTVLIFLCFMYLVKCCTRELLLVSVVMYFLLFYIIGMSE